MYSLFLFASLLATVLALCSKILSFKHLLCIERSSFVCYLEIDLVINFFLVFIFNLALLSVSYLLSCFLQGIEFWVDTFVISALGKFYFFFFLPKFLVRTYLHSNCFFQRWDIAVITLKIISMQAISYYLTILYIFLY